jgi:vacuolar-type H+-ATPase subunit H
MGQLLDLLGYSDEAIQKLIDDYNAAVASGDEEAIKAAEERLKEMYNAIGDFMNEDLDIASQELDEMMASTASNFAELNRLLAEGSINQESYNKQA